MLYHESYLGLEENMTMWSLIAYPTSQYQINRTLFQILLIVLISYNSILHSIELDAPLRSAQCDEINNGHYAYNYPNSKTGTIEKMHDIITMRPLR